MNRGWRPFDAEIPGRRRPGERSRDGRVMGAERRQAAYSSVWVRKKRSISETRSSVDAP
jgi:hypothetical protein